MVGLAFAHECSFVAFGWCDARVAFAAGVTPLAPQVSLCNSAAWKDGLHEGLGKRLDWLCKGSADGDCQWAALSAAFAHRHRMESTGSIRRTSCGPLGVLLGAELDAAEDDQLKADVDAVLEQRLGLVDLAHDDATPIKLERRAQ